MSAAAIFHDRCKLGASVTLFIALAIAGCGATVHNPALENARAAYQKARQDPMIVRNAGAALDRAARALEKADRRWTEDKDVAETEHLAYLAKKRVEIARATAQRRLAETELQRTRSSRR